MAEKEIESVVVNNEALIEDADGNVRAVEFVKRQAPDAGFERAVPPPMETR